MKAIELSITDIDMALDSLKYTKLKFEEYQYYPSYEYKQSRINDVCKVIEKLRALKRDRKSRGKK